MIQYGRLHANMCTGCRCGVGPLITRSGTLPQTCSAAERRIQTLCRHFNDFHMFGRPHFQTFLTLGSLDICVSNFVRALQQGCLQVPIPFPEMSGRIRWKSLCLQLSFKCTKL